MVESQLEIDFVEWLNKKSSEVQTRYERWLEDKDGNCCDRTFCVDCAVIESDKRQAAGEPMHVLCGWDEAQQSDYSRNCEACGIILECSPTREMVEEEIKWLEVAEELDASDAWTFHNMLSGMGDYDREKHWPKIRPHAIRLLTKDGIEVVPEGRISYRPGVADWNEFDSAWIGIYEWFARQLLDWMEQTKKGGLEYLVDASGINLSHFQSVGSRKDLARAIKRLLEETGKRSGRGEFLSSVGISCLADLEKPIRIQDTRGRWPRFDLRGRRFKGVQNKSHPEAVVITRTAFQFSAENRRWSYFAYYDYNHYSSSSWAVCFYQRPSETVMDFVDRANRELEDMLIPDIDARERIDRLKRWDITRQSIENTFYFGSLDCDADVRLTDALVDVKGVSMQLGRIRLNAERLKAIEGWIEEDKNHGAK